MKTLTILQRTVTIDINKLSMGLCEMHNQNEEMKAILSIGMLDSKLCELFEVQLSNSIVTQFSEHTNKLFKTRISEFIKDCNNEIMKGVYGYASMIC